MNITFELLSPEKVVIRTTTSSFVFSKRHQILTDRPNEVGIVQSVEQYGLRIRLQTDYGFDVFNFHWQDLQNFKFRKIEQVL